MKRGIGLLITSMQILLLVQAASAATPAVMIDLDRQKGKVEFLAVGNPSFLKIRGKKAQVTGKVYLTKSAMAAKLIVHLEQFDTGMDLRNRHMKEDYLHVDRYPTAVLKISKLALKKNFVQSASAKIEDIPFSGRLLLHGVERAVVGKASLNKSADRVTGVAELEIDLTDYGIEIPSFKGITVAKKVAISAEIDAPFTLVDLKNMRKRK